MKKFTLLFLFLSSFCFSQMPDISRVWLNKHEAYKGSIGGETPNLKLVIDLSSQDKKNNQEYFVSGFSLVGKNSSNFEGKIKITLYKNSKKGGKVFGKYELFEKPNGKHTGIFKGKFIYTFKWDKTTKKMQSPYLEFVGNWENYEKTISYRTNWNNNF